MADTYGTPADDRTADAPIRIDSPSGLVAAIPYLCGFAPRESAVVVFTAGRPECVGLTLRLDLFDDSDPAAVEAVATHLGAAVDRALGHGVGLATAHVIVFSERAAELPHQGLVATLHGIASARGLREGESLSIVPGRIWSYTCTSGCCPGEGHDAETEAALRTRFDLTMAGLSYLPDREALRSALLPGDRRPLSRRALLAAERDRDAEEASPEAAERWRRASEDAMIAAFVSDLDAERLRSQAPRWSVALGDCRVREPVLHRLVLGIPQQRRRAAMNAARAWLTEMVRIVPGRWGAPVASSLAVLAWQQGDGAFATIAAEHALGANPANTLAQLVRQGAGSGAPPSIWRDVFGSFTLAELRAALPAGSLSPAVP